MGLRRGEIGVASAKQEPRLEGSTLVELEPDVWGEDEVRILGTHVRRRGADVRTFGPNAASADAIGLNLMDRRRAKRVLDAGYRQGLEIAANGGRL